MSVDYALLAAFLVLAGLAVTAYALRALTFAGALASFVMGLAVAVLADLRWVVLMAAFPASSLVVTRIGADTKKKRGIEEARAGERGVANVLGNGLAAVAAVLAIPYVAAPWAAVAFATALAAVAADTFASEIGGLARRARLIVPPFAEAPAGTNGAVSWLGQGAALIGAAAIAWLAVPLIALPRESVWIAIVAGFVGCQIDSLLGATVERDATRDGLLGKQGVNFVASLLPTAAVLAAGRLTG